MHDNEGSLMILHDRHTCRYLPLFTAIVTKKGFPKRLPKEYIEYRYKVRKLNPIWMSLVSRSINIVNLINQHDWLRRRAGSEYGRSKVELKHSFNYIYEQILSNKKFYSIMSPKVISKLRK